MSIRFSRLAMGMFVVAAMVLMAGRSWAIYYQLDPSKDEWGLKYEVQITPAESDKLTVVFTVADEGRLKPFYSTTVVAFSKPDHTGGRTYDLKARIELKKTEDGKHTGEVQIPVKFADRAAIRILTAHVNGKRRPPNGAAYYDIPLKKYMNKAPLASSPKEPESVATPPTSKVTK